MTSLVLRKIGGLMPSVDFRSLPDYAAEVAQNLDLRWGDFRPLKGVGGSVATVTLAVQSIYRTSAGTWLESDTDADVAQWPEDDGAVQTLYITGHMAYPTAWRDGTYRRLGVPGPAFAPEVSVTPVDEFTTAERNTAREAVIQAIQDAVYANASAQGVGYVNLAGALPNGAYWLPHGTVAGMPTVSPYQGCYAAPVTTSGGGVVFTNPLDAYLIDPGLGGKQITYLGNTYWAVPFWAQGQTYKLDIPAIKTALALIKNPADGVSQLIPNDNIDNIGAYLTQLTDITQEPQKTLIDKINYLAVSIAELVLHVAASSLANQFAAFYARSDISTAIESALNNFAAETFVWASRYALASWDNPNVQQGDAAPSPPPPSSPTGVPSTFHANGVEATAKAAIKSGIQAFFAADSSGRKVLDFESARTWMRTEFAEVVDVERSNPSDYQHFKNNMGTVAGDLLNTLNAAIGPTKWANHPNWPQSAQGMDQYKTTALIRLQGEIAAATAELSALYESKRLEVKGAIPTYYMAGLEPRLPPAVERFVEDRFYVVTFVTDRGEESKPSLPSDVREADQNDTVVVSRPPVPSGRFITHWRVYRASSTNAGSAFQYVPYRTDVNDPDTEVEEGIPIANATFTDGYKQSELQETLASLTWDEPPEGLKGIVKLPNGILAGFEGYKVYFSELDKPYAWPREYAKKLDKPVVGLKVFGTTVVATTEGMPYYITGTDPASMAEQKIEVAQACVSKRSMAQVDGGVMYASPDGLCLAGPGGVQLMLAEQYDRDDWQSITPATSFAAYQDGIYYLWTPAGCVSFNLISKQIGVVDQAATAAFTDLATDTLYIAEGGHVRPMLTGSPRTGVWKSKRFVISTHPGFSWVRVEANYPGTVTVRIYLDGALWHTSTHTDVEPKRLPGGKGRQWQIEVQASIPVTMVGLTTSSVEAKAL